MNMIVLLAAGTLVAALWPGLGGRRFNQVLLGLAVLVATLYFLSSRGR